MSPIFNSLVQGAVAGGTTVYLQDRVNREAGEKKVGTWLTVALQVNHLFLLMVETLQAVSIPFGLFGTFVRAIYILTPLVLLTGLREEKITDQEAKVAQHVNKFYYMGVVAVSVATLVLGNPLFALTSLSMLAIDSMVSGKAAEIFAQMRKTAGVLAIVGYGAQVFGGQSAIAGLAMISTVTIVFKIFVWDLFIAPNLPPSRPVIFQNPPPRNPQVVVVNNPSPPPIYFPPKPRRDPPVVIINKPRPKTPPPVVIINNPPPPVFIPKMPKPEPTPPLIYIPKTPSAPPLDKPEPTTETTKPAAPSLWGEKPSPSTKLEPLVRQTGLW